MSTQNNLTVSALHILEGRFAGLNQQEEVVPGGATES
jgi:hypothetical protein